MTFPNLESTLGAKLQAQPVNADYPNKTSNYFDKFKSIDDYLNKHIHHEVNRGAVACGNGWLTDHGPEHIATVIQRASDLSATADLSPYETFLLLVAIHLHDVGNVFGRESHEKKIVEVFDKIKEELGRNTLGEDNGEMRMITSIAMAHGGYADDAKLDKDTITPLRAKWPPSEKGPRVTFLAAILRFADELADDYTRTNRFLLKSGHLQGSEIYHAYADRLRQVIVRPIDNVISIRFEVTTDDLLRTFKKGDAEILLFDEILARCCKLHAEHVYCSRFLVPKILIDTVDVQVNVSRANGTDRFSNTLKRYSFKMQHTGYPDGKSVGDMCPEMRDITGLQVKTEINALERAS